MKLLAAALILAAGTAAADTRGPGGYDVKLPDRVEVEVGGAVSLSLAIQVDRGLTVSKDAGVIVDLAPDDGVAIKKRRLARTDAVDPEADAPRFAIPVHGEAAGDHAVKVRVRFWLCAKHTCRFVETAKTAIVGVSLGAK